MEKVELRDCKIDRINSDAVGPIGRCAGVPPLSARGRRIVPCHLVPVDIGDHPVGKTHAQGQGPDRRGIFYRKGHADIHRGIAVSHVRDIQTDQSLVVITYTG